MPEGLGQTCVIRLLDRAEQCGGHVVLEIAPTEILEVDESDAIVPEEAIACVKIGVDETVAEWILMQPTHQHPAFLGEENEAVDRFSRQVASQVFDDAS